MNHVESTFSSPPAAQEQHMVPLHLVKEICGFPGDQEAEAQLMHAVEE